TPYTRWNNEKTPGVEINATIFLNLIRGDWLSRLSWGTECLLLSLAGLVLGYGLAQARPMVATGLAALAFCLVMLAAVVLVWTTHLWFSWMVVAGAQVPCALAWSVLTYTKTLETQLTNSSSAAKGPPLVTVHGTQLAPVVHDHSLVRVVGKG